MTCWRNWWPASTSQYNPSTRTQCYPVKCTKNTTKCSSIDENYSKSKRGFFVIRFSVFLSLSLFGSRTTDRYFSDGIGDSHHWLVTMTESAKKYITKTHTCRYQYIKNRAFRQFLLIWVSFCFNFLYIDCRGKMTFRGWKSTWFCFYYFTDSYTLITSSMLMHINVAWTVISSAGFNQSHAPIFFSESLHVLKLLL